MFGEVFYCTKVSSLFFFGRVLWIFVEMNRRIYYKFYISLQLLIAARYLYNYKFLLSR